MSDSECGQGFLSLLCPRVRTGSRHTWLQMEAEWEVWGSKYQYSNMNVLEKKGNEKFSCNKKLGDRKSQACFSSTMISGLWVPLSASLLLGFPSGFPNSKHHSLTQLHLQTDGKKKGSSPMSLSSGKKIFAHSVWWISRDLSQFPWARNESHSHNSASRKLAFFSISHESGVLPPGNKRSKG